MINITIGSVAEIENFDALSKEHWADFNDRDPALNGTVLSASQVVIARYNSVPIGYILFRIGNSLFYDEKWCYGGMFYLQRPHRGKGIGKEMFALLEKTAKEQQCSRIVSSYNLKQPLDGFYDKLGFSATHVSVAKEI